MSENAAATRRHHAVYQPASRVDAGPVQAFRTYGREIGRGRWQIWMAFRRQFKASYSRTFFGIFWALALPMVPILAYVLLASMRVIATTEQMPHIIYISLGVTLYTWCTAPIAETMAAIRSEGSLLAKTHVGCFTIILGRFGSLAFDTLVRLCLVGVLMVAFSAPPDPVGVLLFLPALLLTVAACLGAGIFLTVVNTVLPDVEKITGVVLRFAVFFSAVLFPLPGGSGIAALIRYNPFYVFVDNLRTLLMFGSMANAGAFLVVAGGGLALLTASVVLLYRSEPHIRAAA